MSDVLWCVGVAAAFVLGLVIGVLLSRQRVTLKSGGIEISAMSTREVVTLVEQLQKPAKDQSATTAALLAAVVGVKSAASQGKPS